ncbi:1-deoxy-D-xylulose-5-phosphate reductoisomerase [Ahniella affigens]|uniref:1-deoxy-D-xylulose 5-phosphate reductoisomerase n=1 Tax=Ahniella affigens TaxID=2021234 RepID=A0A2P1PMI3_9GAMM|nr:1-deoxy-D-xylulose-5-phosphate reductoisomerase [Ahniella affigens]AVP96051.1 1-deoxy-D-xylulose-5-phosphate reductoisomerase [Ahniella affigens]
MKRVAVFGATGSIGRSSLDVIGRHPDRLLVHALSAHRDRAGLEALIRTHRPNVAVLTDPLAADGFEAFCRLQGVRGLIGPDALDAVAAESGTDMVIAGIVGAAGLSSTLAAARAGKTLLLANKEAVVMAGALLKDAVAASGAKLVPLDSEHNAIFQCLPTHAVGARADGVHTAGVDCLWLTASGGPFRGRRRAELSAITPEQACAHPKWNMGRKISVDSATLMNKGLEVIEAHHLFDMPADRIRVVVHPESTVHSVVAYCDGSMLAQLGAPDMRVPIAHALGFPERLASGVAPLNLLELGQLRFEAPDLDTFRCLALAFAALKSGQAASIALNAANEVAVAAFLDGRLPFLGIDQVVELVLNQSRAVELSALDAILDFDQSARVLAAAAINKVVI